MFRPAGNLPGRTVWRKKPGRGSVPARFGRIADTTVPIGPNVCELGPSGAKQQGSASAPYRERTLAERLASGPPYVPAPVAGGGGKPLVPPLTPPPPAGGVGEVPVAPLAMLNVVTMPICENSGSTVTRT